MTKHNLKVADKVICNGFAGRVTRLVDDSLVEVELESGGVCVDATDTLTVCPWSGRLLFIFSARGENITIKNVQGNSGFLVYEGEKWINVYNTLAAAKRYVHKLLGRKVYWEEDTKPIG